MSQDATFATIEDIVIPQGASFTRDYIIKDDTGAVVDVTGAAVRAMLRRGFSSTTPIATFTCAVVNGPAGLVRISLTPADTAVIKVRGGKRDGEVQLPNGDVYRFIEGDWKTSFEATK